MKRLMALVLVFVILISSSCFAQKRIEINIPSRTLKLFDNDKFVKIYPIAVGKPSSDSPIGHYKILNKQVNPTWHPKGKKPVPPGPNNPLGTRWMEFYSAYGIHGNSNPASIGTYASAGCIRMQNFDVEEVFDKVQVGNIVDIYYNTIYTYDNPDKSKSALIVYSDLYRRNSNSMTRIKQELDKLGLLDQIDNDKLQRLYKDINKETVIFAKGWTLFVNGEFISPDTRMKSSNAGVDSDQGEREEVKQIDKISNAENVLVNIYDINLLFGLDLQIDSDGNLSYKGMPIYYEIKDGIAYVAVLDAVRAIEGYYNIDEEQEKIDWTIPYGKLNGEFFRLDIKTTGHEVLASVRDVVNALNLQGEWDEGKSALLVNDKEIKGKIIGGRMYITPKQIKDYFGLDSSYYSFQNRMELYGK